MNYYYMNQQIKKEETDEKDYAHVGWDGVHDNADFQLERYLF